MWKTIFKWLLIKSLDWFYFYADKDKDGKLSKEEIESIVSLIRSYAIKIKRKI